MCDRGDHLSNLKVKNELSHNNCMGKGLNREAGCTGVRIPSAG